MTSKITDVELLGNRDRGPIGPLDGRVGATIMEGTYFITSANQDVIFAPPLGNLREVKLRADTLYGDDDPILWPQPYMPHNCHFGAIPRSDSLAGHEIIWWSPNYDDFAKFKSDLSPISGLGKLSPRKYSAFEHSILPLLERGKAYAKATPPEQQPPMLQPMVKWLEHDLAQLKSVYATYRQVVFVVRDVQRVWLELRAFLDYMEIYKPRMDGYLPAAIAVAETIGVFTHSIRVAQDFFTAGLPCWLIRPANNFTEQIIQNVVELLHPESYPGVVLVPHSFRYPVIFAGPASSAKKYQSIYNFARNFLHCPGDLFKDSDTEASSTLGPSRVPEASSVPGRDLPPHANNQPVAGSRRSSLCVRSETRSRNMHRKPVPKSDVHQIGYQKAAGTASRDKFLPITNSTISPTPLRSWGTALAAVNQDPNRVEPMYRTRNDRKYLFPEPGIFVGANEMRRARYFALWQAIEPVCIYRVTSPSTAVPLSNQEWRNILIGNIASKSSTSKAAVAREHAYRLLGPAVNNLDVMVNETLSTVTPSPLGDSEARWILWRLTELNFRFELLSLDKRAGPSGRDEVQRQQSVCECLQIVSLLAIDAQEAGTGLCSDDWRMRLPCLLKLRDLMKTWQVPRPPALLKYDLTPDQDFLESDALLLEDGIAHFYTDSFFRFFGRAAVIPAHLPTPK